MQLCTVFCAVLILKMLLEDQLKFNLSGWIIHGLLIISVHNPWILVQLTHYHMVGLFVA
jgi:uncharacterized membrane protein